MAIGRYRDATSPTFRLAKRLNRATPFVLGWAPASSAVRRHLITGHRHGPLHSPESSQSHNGSAFTDTALSTLPNPHSPTTSQTASQKAAPSLSLSPDRRHRS
ncbi:hypothetical protein AAFF_G00251110 [Aldrovandia affinis]|uniref:Uncharacterized protein n=1 Tax=Aldrovandia affinis TaxID=143900 RepID=A0AAD7RCS0_9TELE|nr:hypothetical protein AAFF_G00251110 [Aldrovandia affinis]